MALFWVSTLNFRGILSKTGMKNHGTYSRYSCNCSRPYFKRPKRTTIKPSRFTAERLISSIEASLFSSNWGCLFFCTWWKIMTHIDRDQKKTCLYMKMCWQCSSFRLSFGKSLIKTLFEFFLVSHELLSQDCLPKTNNSTWCLPSLNSPSFRLNTIKMVDFPWLY